MPQIRKAIFILAIGFISFYLLTVGFIVLQDLEFKSADIESLYYKGSWLLPLAVLLILTGTLKQPLPTSKWGLTIVAITVLLALVTSIVLFLGSLIRTCQWSAMEVIYKSKNDTGKKIIKQRLDCIVNEESTLTQRIVEQRSCFIFFTQSRLVDTTRIDQTIWVKP